MTIFVIMTFKVFVVIKAILLKCRLTFLKNHWLGLWGGNGLEEVNKFNSKDCYTAIKRKKKEKMAAEIEFIANN